MSDGHLIGRAFDRWGEDISAHLQGDWALAGWDRRERKLLLALNACGNATLYYYEGKDFLAFASSLKALLVLPGVVKKPDLLYLAQLLVSWPGDPELTAYEGFRSLVWAHAITVGLDGQTRRWRHWSPAGREPLTYRRDQDYEEAFLENYNRAVQSCLRTQKPVAAMLSAGRDSGSVVALAAPLLASQGRSLTAYTSVPRFPPDGSTQQRIGNEWNLAQATAKMAGANVNHIAIDASDYGVLEGIEHLLEVHDGPSHATCNHYWLQALVEAASKNGAGVLLTGQMGNATVSWSGNGSALLALLHGQAGIALQLLLHANPNPWQTLKRQMLKPMLFRGQRLLRRYRSPGNAPWRAYSAINLRMASNLNLEARMRAAHHDPTFTVSPLEDLRLRLFAPDLGVGVGMWSEMGARHQLAYIDPTANLSLVEFLLRVPDTQFVRSGQSSWLLRRSFRGRLPEPVLDGRQKGLQAADVGHRILEQLPAFQQCLDSLSANPAANEFLDLPLLNRCLQDLVAKVDPITTDQAVLTLLRGVGVGLFLLQLT